MKTILCLVLAFCGTGCLEMDRAAINDSANVHLQALDRQCKTHMTDWCVVQYQRVEYQRQADMEDARNTAMMRAAIMQNSFRR